ncbi:MAG: hypothetical protein ACI4I6_00215 [Hominimerdicola sp.]
MKKVIIGAVSLCMAAVIFTSCSDSESSSSAVTTTEAVTTTADLAESEVTEESSEITIEPTVVAPPDTEVGQALTNYENASLRFSEEMNVSDFAKPLAASDYADDESQINLSIETFDGVSMLKVETLDKNKDGDYKSPKVKLLMNKLFEGQESKLADIYTVRIDIVTRAVGNAIKDDESEALVPGFFGGKIITQTLDGQGSLSWNELYEFGESEWEKEWGCYELVIRPGMKEETAFTATKEEQYLTIMRWSIPNDACFYIADIKFEDEDGNVLACSIGN